MNICSLHKCKTCDWLRRRSCSAVLTVPNAVTASLNANGAFPLAEPLCGDLHFHDQFNQTEPLRATPQMDRLQGMGEILQEGRGDPCTPQPVSYDPPVLKQAFCFSYWGSIVTDMF